MDRRLTGRSLSRRSGARRVVFVGLVAAVALMHVGVSHEIALELAAIEAADTMPARIRVVYVHTLEPEVPKAAVPAAPAATPARSRAAHKVRAPAVAVSAAAPPVVAAAEAEPPKVDDAASAPQAPVAAASAPSDASSAVAAAEPASAPAANGFVWPSATKVSYILNGNYRGDLNGRAEVEWIRVGERYQVNVDLYAGPEFAPIFSRHMTSEGEIAESGLVPERYGEETQFLTNRRHVGVTFSADSVELANGDKRERLPGVQDTASQFIQFTWLFGSKPELLHVGASFVFPLALPRSMKSWTYDVVGEETLYTPFGELPVFHLKPRIVERKPGELTVEMWFAPELRYLPVRIRIEQDAGTYVDLVIAKKPEISAS